MSRLSALLVIALVGTVTGGQVMAQEPYKAWMEFLKGDWEYEIKELNLKGTASWTLTAKGNVMVGRFTDTNGLISQEISGWRSDKKRMVASGYGAQGNYWSIEAEVTADHIEGPNHGILPDGRTYKGVFVGKKVDEDQYEWHFKGRIGEKEHQEMAGTYVRQTPVAKRSTRKEFAELFEAMKGNWKGDIELVTDIPGIGKKGDKKSVRVEHLAAADSKALVGKGQDAAGGEATILMFIDLGSRQIKRTTVFNGGTVVSAVAFKQDGKWIEVSTATEPGGKKTRGVATL